MIDSTGCIGGSSPRQSIAFGRCAISIERNAARSCRSNGVFHCDTRSGALISGGVSDSNCKGIVALFSSLDEGELSIVDLSRFEVFGASDDLNLKKETKA